MNEMKTGTMPSTTQVLNVGAENKKVVMVNPQDMMTQSSSASRGGRMDIKPGAVNPIKPSNKDTYQ